jgi:hypothetical protein
MSVVANNDANSLLIIIGPDRPRFDAAANGRLTDTIRGLKDPRVEVVGDGKSDISVGAIRSAMARITTGGSSGPVTAVLIGHGGVLGEHRFQLSLGPGRDGGWYRTSEIIKAMRQGNPTAQPTPIDAVVASDYGSEALKSTNAIPSGLKVRAFPMYQLDRSSDFTGELQDHISNILASGSRPRDGSQIFRDLLDGDAAEYDKYHGIPS